MRAGVEFWDAVEQAQKQQPLHDQFGKKALVNMLVSAIYWEQLDSTPWFEYVPAAYYEAAIKRVRDANLSQPPPNWDPLPARPDSGEGDDSSIDTDFSDEGNGDLDDDEDYDDKHHSGGSSQSKKSKQSSTQSPSQGKNKRKRGSDGPGSGSSKRSRTSPQVPAQSSSHGRSGPVIPQLPMSDQAIDQARTLIPQQLPARPSSRSRNEPPAPPDDGVIEVPRRGQGSYLRFGIRVQNLPRQTLGFPRYAPCKSHIRHLRQRWEPVAYVEILRSKPWDAMWNQRIQTLVFFRYDELGPDMVEALTRIVNFMSLWRRAYWERLHWVTMDTDFDYEAMATLLDMPELLELYRDRKERSAEFEAQRREMMQEVCEVNGYTDDIWYEPGLWVVPQDPCHWIVRDPSLGISLPDQLETLDDAEPARTQFATRRSDNAFLNLAPAALQDDFMNENEQAQYPIDPSPIYDQAELENVLPDIRRAQEEEEEE